MNEVDAHPRRTLCIRLGVLTVAAVLIDLGSIHTWHQADSLLPVLVSTLRWTFYYWEQNRYGMLTALLAQPFSDPFVNLLVQNGITIWAGLATFPLASAYYGLRKPWLAGAVAATLYVAMTPAMMQWTFFSTYNVFSVSLALGLAGLNALSQTRWSWTVRLGVAASCFLLGSWVNSALGLLLAPLVVLVPFLRTLCASGFIPEVGTAIPFNPQVPIRHSVPSSGASPEARRIAGSTLREVTVGLAFCGFGIVAAMMMQRTTPYRTTWIVLPPTVEWRGQFAHALETILRESDPILLWLTWTWTALVLVAAAVALRRRTGITEVRRAALLPAFVLMASLAYAAAMLILFAGRWRYAVPSMLMIHVAVFGTFVSFSTALWSPRRLLLGEFGSAFALMIAIVAAWGWPSPQRAKEELFDRHDTGVAELVQSRATHLTGDYWRVWPAVFCVNQTYSDLGDDRRLWGVTFRSEPTFGQWTAIPPSERRIAAFTSDDEAQKYRDWFSEVLKKTETDRPIEIWVTE